MTLLMRIYYAQRLLHNSHQCWRSSSVSNGDITDITSKNTPRHNNGNPAKKPENEIISSERKENLLDGDSTLNENEDPILPEEPTTCCMSGCANCVWVEYADKLSQVLKDGEKSREIVLTKVTDPNMKAFLLMELKSLKNKDDD